MEQEKASLRSRGGLRRLRTLVSRARREGRALQRQRVAAVEAVRHFLGFADDSDARVGRTAHWRRLVIVGEHGVARVEGTAFWRSLLSVSLPQR